MPEVKNNPQRADSQPPKPSEKLQWAFFWALLAVTCLIIIVSIVMYYRSGSPWSFALDFLDIPLGTLWVRMAMHLYPIDPRELEARRKDTRRRTDQKPV